jgi:hypothetical protein
VRYYFRIEGVTAWIVATAILAWLTVLPFIGLLWLAGKLS